MRAEKEKTMAGEGGLNMPRFYLKAAVVVMILAGLSSLKTPHDFVAGVLAGGALSIINLREMHKGLRVILGMERPSARRLLFSGILRLIILASAIIVIAAMKLVNLLGLLIGFAVVPLVLLIEGLVFARKLQSVDTPEPPTCSHKSRQH